MQIHNSTDFEFDDIEGTYCYLENTLGHHVATITIKNTTITVIAARSDYQAVIDVVDFEMDDDTLDTINETLFVPAGWVVSIPFLEQILDIALKQG